MWKVQLFVFVETVLLSMALVTMLTLIFHVLSLCLVLLLLLWYYFGKQKGNFLLVASMIMLFFIIILNPMSLLPFIRAGLNDCGLSLYL